MTVTIIVSVNLRLSDQVPLYSQIRPNCRIYSVIRRSFSFHNNSENLDPSYKTDLDLCDCLGKVKLVL